MRKIIAAAVIGLMATASQAVTIVNGSFENGTFTAAPFDTLAGGDSSITGWTIGDAGVDWIGSYWQASDGNRSLDLSAVSGGSVSQAITTEIGKTYRVSFDLAGNPDGGPYPKQLLVTVDGVDPGNYSFLTGSTSRLNMGWVGKTYRFTATSTSSLLKFTSLANTPSGPALDNVSISAVPEASTWVMLVAGFGLVGFTARRRRHTVAA